MNEIRDIYEKRCFFGYRRITEVLRRQNQKSINRKKILRLMRQMSLRAVYPKKQLSKKAEGHKVYPYLLRDKIPQKPDDCWGVDITYIRVCGGYAYLTALIDWASRRIMGWSLSPFLETNSCLEALNAGLIEGQPQIINSDQGSQFTSSMWIEELEKNDIKISMDGKGRCIDNIQIERFWRSLKYEEVYLKSYDSMNQARREIKSYIQFYNQERPHQSLGYKTPNEVYWAEPEEGVPPPLALGL
jgi:putative transposase